MKQMVRAVLLFLARLLGSHIVDEKTGKPLGRGLIIAWGGKVHLIGLSGFLVPRYTTQSRLTFWKQEIGFTQHDAVDYPSHVTPSCRMGQTGALERSLVVLLAHQPAREVAAMLKYWKSVIGDVSIVVVYGGRSRSEFDAIDAPFKFFAPSARLRTKDHQRDRQSYHDVFATTAELVARSGKERVLFCEADHFPVDPKYIEHLESIVHSEEADVLFHYLKRVNQTNWPIWLAESHGSMLNDWFGQHSVRAGDMGTMLWAFVSGSYWTSSAWIECARHPEPFPVYLEIWLPSLMHHLGYRLREIPGQKEFVRNVVAREVTRTRALAAGSWTIHPVKGEQIARGALEL